MNIYLVLILIGVELLQINTTQAETLVSVVPATKKKTCAVQLRVPEGASNLPLIYSQSGTGVYSRADDHSLPGHIDYIFKKKRAAILTLDKPGITYSEGGVSVDDPVYNAYTQSDLVICSLNAMEWALK